MEYRIPVHRLRIPWMLSEGNRLRIPWMLSEGDRLRIPWMLSEGDRLRIPWMLNEGDTVWGSTVPPILHVFMLLNHTRTISPQLI
jgi:hypothetical protein